MTTKYDIKIGEVHLAKYGNKLIPLEIIDVLERADNETIIRHNYNWESLTEFMTRRPARMGRIRKILGIRCGIIREPNMTNIESHTYDNGTTNENGQTYLGFAFDPSATQTTTNTI